MNAAVARLREHWVTPALLLLVCLLSYGLWVPWLGAYWDDWWLIWAAETGGATRVLDGLAEERPLHGLLYAMTSAVYAVSPVALHLLVLAARWASAVAAWWTLRAIWPGRRVEAVAIALLLIVYPGFSQQSLPLSYSNQFFTLTFFFLSLGGMLWALRRPRRFWPLMAIAMVSAIPAHWVMEYWLGLELLRWPLALWVIRDEPGVAHRVKRATLVTAPFYAAVVARVLWNLLFLERQTELEQSLSGYIAAIIADPVKELSNRLGYALTDFADAIVFAWSRAAQPDMFDMRLRFVLAGVLLVAVVAVLSALCMRAAGRSRDRAGEVAGDEGGADAGVRWPIMAMALGLGTIVVGQLPMWITDRHIEWRMAALDRHSLGAMLGAAIFVTGLARLVTHRRAGFIGVIALLVGLGASFQFRQGHVYVRQHEQQADFFWQLHWRAPALESGTTLFLHHAPLSLPQSKDYTYAAPLNLIYDAGHEARQVTYWLFPDAPGFQPYWLMLLSEGDPRLERQIQQLPIVRSDTVGDAELKRQVLNLFFHGSTDRSVVLLHRPPGCLRVLEPGKDDVIDIPPAVRAARRHSRPELIRADGRHSVAVLERYFGPEPGRGWCYHYQRAELRRQLGDWGGAAEVADLVRRKGLGPVDRTEWIPFIEAYARTGRYEEAERLVREAAPYRGTIWNLYDRYAGHRAFCDLEGRLAADGLLEGPGSRIFAIGEDRLLECAASGAE